MRKLKNICQWATIALLMALISACELLPGSEAEVLKASGVVEVTEISIAPELGGRVKSVTAEEGDRVGQGEALFEIEGDMLAARQDQADAALESAQAQLTAADEGLNVAESAIEMAEINFEIAQLQYEAQLARALQDSATIRAREWIIQPPERIEQPGWYFSRTQEIQALSEAASNADLQLQEDQTALDDLIAELGGDDLRVLEDSLNQAQAQFIVAQELYFRPVEADEDEALRAEIRDRYELARDALEDAQEELDRELNQREQDELIAARAKVSVSRETYLVTLLRYYRALSGEDAPAVQIAKKQTVQAEIALEQANAAGAQAEAQVRLAEKAVAQAEANLALVELQREKLVVRAPAAGSVLTSSIVPGEVVQPGGSVMTIGVLDELYITVYLPENQYGLLNLGDEAEVEVDSFPDEIFKANVVRIANEAEYTPRNVQTEEERQTTVYAIELRVISGGDKLKPGMPADVIFDLPDSKR